jgi:hypothetical protein
MQKITILFLILISSTAFAISTTLSDALHKGSQAIKSRAAPKTDVLDARDTHMISITGTITSSDGSAAENFTVKAFIAKMGGTQVVGSTLTDEGGAYTIAFPYDSPATILVKVYCKTTLLGESPPQHNVTEGAGIDFTVPSSRCTSGIPARRIPEMSIKKTGS